MRLLPLVFLAACAGAPDPQPTPDPAPVVLRTTPPAGAVDVSRDIVVTYTFDRAIDPDLATVRAVPSVAGALSWDEASLTLSWDPNTRLLADTPYTLTLADEIGLEGDHTLRFTTGSGTATVEQVERTYGPYTTTTTLDEAVGARTYTLTTTQPRRDNVPASGSRTILEPDGLPQLRSGDLPFDANFALAMVETRENSITEITNYAFRDGAPAPCDCFETGESWTYVWTRDTAYAADLGLAALDPVRAKNSLDFKLSRPRDGGALRIVQDTGSGGSWPVSTDRVAWARGAERVLHLLPPAEAAAWRPRVLEALATTIAEDRAAIWQADSGLYRGEQSFLDWREQSYPSWTATDQVPIAASESLSTNAVHHAILRIAASIAADAGDSRAAAWSTQADDLAASIRAAFTLPDGALSTYRLGPYDPVARPAQDLLGTSLAVLEGIVRDDAAVEAVAAYPRAASGPPVFWPLRPQARIYHNRAAWPFVTAYGALSARAVSDEARFTADLNALLRGSALNLSNMENLELLTGLPWLDAGAESGPVVNSRRQLWSVAGYAGAVIHGLFGLETSAEGVRFVPFVPPDVHLDLLGGGESLHLDHLTLRGVPVDVHIDLPLPGDRGGAAYTLADVEVDGVDIDNDTWLDPATLPAGAVIDLRLSNPEEAGSPAVDPIVDRGDYRDLWPPQDPAPVSLATSFSGGLMVTWGASAEDGVVYDLSRDGAWLATGLTGTSFPDTEALLDDGARCYTVTHRFVGSGHASAPSPATCWDRWEDLGVRRWAQTDGDGAYSTQHGREHWMDWGDEGDTLTLRGWRPGASGLHAIEVRYGNGAGGFDTGITCGTKWLEVLDGDGLTVAEGLVALPHLGVSSTWSRSTPLFAELRADTDYTLVLSHHDNMSDLQHFADYTGGTGGAGGAFHRVNISGAQALPLAGSVAGPAPALTFDGSDDLDTHAPTQRLDATDLGATLQPWDAFALSWDDANLYLTVVSSAFEEDFAPFHIYLQATDGPPGAASPAAGHPYSRGVVSSPAALPFTPTHLLALRANEAGGPDGGPYPGAWLREGGVYVPQHRFTPGVDSFLAADRHTLSVTVPRGLLDGATHLRLAGHVVWGPAGQEWKDLVPSGHTPWSGGGAFYTVDLTGDPAAAGWTLTP